MLATHYGYRATTKKPASNCFFTSSFIFKDVSGFILLSFCFTGEHSGFRGNRCCTMSELKLGISWYDQQISFDMFHEEKALPDQNVCLKVNVMEEKRLEKKVLEVGTLLEQG